MRVARKIQTKPVVASIRGSERVHEGSTRGITRGWKFIREGCTRARNRLQPGAQSPNAACVQESCASGATIVASVCAANAGETHKLVIYWIGKNTRGPDNNNKTLCYVFCNAMYTCFTQNVCICLALVLPTQVIYTRRGAPAQETPCARTILLQDPSEQVAPPPPPTTHTSPGLWTHTLRADLIRIPSVPSLPRFIACLPRRRDQNHHQLNSE